MLARHAELAAGSARRRSPLLGDDLAHLGDEAGLANATAMRVPCLNSRP